MTSALRRIGVTPVTPSEGLISELYIGLKGTMNAMFTRDLADKTGRGCGEPLSKENRSVDIPLDTLSLVKMTLWASRFETEAKYQRLGRFDRIIVQLPKEDISDVLLEIEDDLAGVPPA